MPPNNLDNWIKRKIPTSKELEQKHTDKPVIEIEQKTDFEDFKDNPSKPKKRKTNSKDKKYKDESVKVEPVKSNPELSALNEQPQLDEAQPLSGKRVVLTGLFDLCQKNDFSELIKKAGGICTTAVSGLTDMLVCGKILEDERPVFEGRKYKKAKEIQESSQRKKDIQILTEEEFFIQYPSIKTNQIINQNINATDAAICDKNENSPKLKIQNGFDNSVSCTSNIWIEKWRPQTIDGILGNEKCVQNLIRYLLDWHDVCILGNKKPVPLLRASRPGRFPESERINARAVMLSGPPGIGKTTTAKVVSRHCGYHVVEFNASDDRGKSIIDVIDDMANGGVSLDSFFGKQKTKTLIVMDEMDGLSQGDRGGGAALIKLIEKTRCPVICICNDRYNPKLRSIVSKCYDLQFQKPSKNTIIKYMISRLEQEGVSVDYDAIELICDHSGNDLRQIINTLQSLAQETSAKITLDLVNTELQKGLKDLQVMDSAFDVVNKLLNQSKSSQMSINDKLYAYFTDYDLIPLMMSENYLNSFKNKINKNPSDTNLYKNLSVAARCISQSDIINRKCRESGYWSLLSDVGFFSVIIPSTTISGFLPFPSFPSWLGRNSTKSKNKRLLYELQVSMVSQTLTVPGSMQTNGLLDALYLKVTLPLLNQKSVKDAVNVLSCYNLTKTQFSENLTCLRMKSQINLYEQVESSIKRSFTTAANASQKTQTLPKSIKSNSKYSDASEMQQNLCDTEAPLKDIDEENRSNSSSDESVLSKLVKNKKAPPKKKLKSAVKPTKRKVLQI